MSVNRRTFLHIAAASTAAALTGLPAPAAAPARNGIPYRELGKTGEQVSLLCIGGAHLGRRPVDEALAIRVIRKAVDEGVNFLDNAWAYGNGEAEKRMGKALRDGYRDKVFLMTKQKGLDAATAQQHLEDSLRRLQTDVIDLWQHHEVVRPEQPGQLYDNGAVAFAAKARDEGKIRYIGFTGHFLPSAHLEMIERGFEWDATQMPLSVLDHHYRSFEKEVLPKCVARKIGVIAMKTLGGNQAFVNTGVASAAECLRFAMSLPVATVCSGIDSMEFLEHNLSVARDFTPMSEAEMTDLLARCAEAGGNGQYEAHKTMWHGDIRRRLEEEGVELG